MSGRAQPGLTIRCQELVELITDYLEDAVDDATRAEVEAHLRLCPGCASYLEQMHSTIRTLGHVPLETLSGEAKANLVAAFRTYGR